jgi:hypothetical protein
MGKNTVKTYQVELYFDVDKRERLRFHKMVNLYKLYEKVIVANSYGKMKQEIYTAFRNNKIDDAVIDRFWNRFIKAELQREEEIEEKRRRIKQIELENLRRGRAI